MINFRPNKTCRSAILDFYNVISDKQTRHAKDYEQVL